mgnify:CR=1 FL=1
MVRGRDRGIGRFLLVLDLIAAERSSGGRPHAVVHRAENVSFNEAATVSHYPGRASLAGTCARVATCSTVGIENLFYGPCIEAQAGCPVNAYEGRIGRSRLIRKEVNIPGFCT